MLFDAITLASAKHCKINLNFDVTPHNYRRRKYIDENSLENAHFTVSLLRRCERAKKMNIACAYCYLFSA